MTQNHRRVRSCPCAASGARERKWQREGGHSVLQGLPWSGMTPGSASPWCAVACDMQGDQAGTTELIQSPLILLQAPVIPTAFKRVSLPVGCILVARKSSSEAASSRDTSASIFSKPRQIELWHSAPIAFGKHSRNICASTRNIDPQGGGVDRRLFRGYVPPEMETQDPFDEIVVGRPCAANGVYDNV